jgi:hypothetical protein
MPAGTAGAERPIFIVGAAGTGSTLLRLMLDSHPRIAIPSETGFLRLAAAHSWVPYWQLGDQWSANLDLDDDALMSELGRFYGGLFSRYAEARGKPRWGEKTPLHVWHLQLAKRMFPDFQVVGIVRHPGAVVTSQRRRFRRTYQRAARSWRRSTRQLLDEAMLLGDQCVVLRYEDLVADPEVVARALLEWLDEPWSDAVLGHHELQPSGAVAEGFTAVDRPIDTSRTSEWESYLRGSERRRVLASTAPLAGVLGYDITRTMPLGEFGADHAGLLTGTTLRERRATHGAGINWEKRQRPGYADRPLRPPAPRRRRKPLTLDDVTFGTLLQHRLNRLGHRLPVGVRQRANDLRRRSRLLDRLLGPGR